MAGSAVRPNLAQALAAFVPFSQPLRGRLNVQTETQRIALRGGCAAEPGQALAAFVPFSQPLRGRLNVQTETQRIALRGGCAAER